MTILDKKYQINELIYESQKTLVYRGECIFDRLKVIIKIIKTDYVSFSEILLLQHQYNILKDLDIQGAVKPIGFKSYKNNFVLILEDFGEASLQKYFHNLKPQNLTSETIDKFLSIFFPVAIHIAKILEELYVHQIVHKDIKPANIRIDLKTGQVKLDNFSYATRLLNEDRQSAKIKVFEGTLAYASPEQTGRIDREIDYRSDLYSLGITFYELLTGILPFELEDRIELIHAHLTKVAIPINHINPLIPQTLSVIIAKLMAKNAEDRYQSALGLQRDLEYCWSQWQTVGKIEAFELGKYAADDRFVISEKIYGRTTEVQILLNTFQRIAFPVKQERDRGGAESILLSGFFGVGKTALINEACKLIRQHRCYLIKTNFIDRAQDAIPFSALIPAFCSLIEQLSIEDDDRLAEYKAKILTGLGKNAQVIIDVIPGLVQIIGPQLPAKVLSASATQHRFKLLFQTLIKILLNLAQPLVICLEDLQWIDEDSLELLELLMQAEGKILTICAYRDNELSGIHPLMLTVNRLKRMGITVNHMMLSPLSREQLDRLIADSFNCSIDLVRPLAEIVDQKTNGNPFFAIEFLKSLARDGLIEFNPQSGSWQCDLSQIKVQHLTNDEIELMATQLQQLPLFTQQILKLAACIGMEFDLQTLTIIAQQSAVAVLEMLFPALQAGSIVPSQETYNFVRSATDLAAVAGIASGQKNRADPVVYRFTHDRVQQAAYSLIPAPERASVHAQIGELLLETISAATIVPARTSADPDWLYLAAGDEDRLLLSVNQLNRGIGLALEPAKRDLLIELNLAASRQARANNDYPMALASAQVALKLLENTAWQQNYDLALTVYELAIELAALCGAFELMNQWSDETIAHVNTPLELVGIYIVQIQSLVAQDGAVTAIEIARSLLAQLGVQLPLSPTLRDVEAVMREINDLIILAGSIEALIDLPMMTDPRELAIMRVAASMMGACYLTDPHLPALVVALQVKLSIQAGNSPISAYGYAAYGIVINKYLQNVALADRFGGLAYRLATKPTARNIRPETLAAISLFLYHRNSHLRATMPILQAGYQAGLETGKLEYVGYQIEGLISTAYWCGDNLAELESRFLADRQQLLDFNQLTTANHIAIYCETVLVLLANPDRVNLAFDRVTDEELILASKDVKRVFVFYFHRAMLRFLMGDIAQANLDVCQARKYLHGVAGLINEVAFYFYDSLIALAVEWESEEAAAWQARVRANQKQLAHWAKYAPMNHLHKWQLVEAETYRVLGNKATAIEFYDRAIAGAQANQYRQEVALANELAAKFYLTWGKAKIAADYFQSAYHYYTQWGATAKIQDLTSHYPHLLEGIALAPTMAETLTGRLSLSSPSQLDLAHSSTVQSLDFNAYIKAIQALYSEIDLDRLLRILMDVVVENAGADKASLLLNHDGKLTIEVDYHHGEIDTLDFDLQTFDGGSPAARSALRSSQDAPVTYREYRVPLLLIRHVQRHQTAEIHNGIDHPYLFNDPYFEEHQPQSILCMPILNQNKLIGILYLENSLIGGAFSRDRVELLNIICTQAAISVENARLHQETQAYAQMLEQSLRDLQASEARLHKVADNIPGVIAQICIYPDRESEILRYISSGCVKLYELTAVEMITQGYSLRCFEHPEDRPEIDIALARSRQQLTPIELEYRIVTASGKVKWIYLAASSPELQPDGSLLTECTILDISERQAVIQERQQFELKLQATNQELIRSNRLKDQFMANMSHELRTPLNAILGMTEGLKELVFGDINQAQLTALNTIEHSGTHLLALINDILDLAKIEAGQGELNCAPTAIDSLCESSLVFIDRQAAQKQLQVDVKIQPNLPDLNIDERRMRQVLINLLNNAVKFTPAGGQIGLEVAYLEDFSVLDLNPAAGVQGWLRITISDTGIGISPDNIQQLFQPFVQIDGALNRQFEGTGLGLALVKRMVELHGGKVGVSSELGLGSSFTVDLPCDRLPVGIIAGNQEPKGWVRVSEVVAKQDPDRTPDRSPLILLVEDSEANISTMSSYLKAKGYQIVIATNGQEAIDLTRSTRPDIILMDMQMPVMDGLTATRQIREFSDVPIIALTALAMTGDREQCLKAGANEYLSKPVKLKQLTTIIQQSIVSKNC